MSETPATKPPLKARARTTIRKFALEVAILVGGTWFTAWLAQKGAFTDPQGQINAVGAFLLWLTAQGWFQWLSGIVLGFTAGAWIDARLKIKDVPRFLWHKLNRKVPSLESVYRHDFSGERLGTMARASTDNYEAKLEDGGVINFHASQIIWFDGRAMFLTFFLPPNNHLLELCKSIIENLNVFLALQGSLAVDAPGRSTSFTTGDLVFSGRIFLYYAPHLSSAQLAEIEAVFAEAGLSVQIRGTGHALNAALGGDGSIYTDEPQRTLKLAAKSDGPWEIQK